MVTLSAALRTLPTILIDQGTELLVGTIERSEAGHRIGVVEVPRILGEPDEVADGGVGSPGATKRRTA